MSTNEAKKKYDLQYAKDKLKRIPLDVKKEKYEEIKAAAEAVGEPINGYIKKAIDDRMERETVSAAGHPAPSGREHEAMAAGFPEPPPKKPEKHYKPFTEADARRIDLPELLKNVKYQIDIADTFGMDALTALMEKAGRQAAEAENQQGGIPLSS